MEKSRESGGYQGGTEWLGSLPASQNTLPGILAMSLLFKEAESAPGNMYFLLSISRF